MLPIIGGPGVGKSAVYVLSYGIVVEGMNGALKLDEASGGGSVRHTGGSGGDCGGASGIGASIGGGSAGTALMTGGAGSEPKGLGGSESD
jgi:hypothetical protein